MEVDYYGFMDVHHPELDQIRWNIRSVALGRVRAIRQKDPTTAKKIETHHFRYYLADSPLWPLRTYLYEVTGLEKRYVIDREGRLVQIHTTFPENEQKQKRLQKYVWGDTYRTTMDHLLIEAECFSDEGVNFCTLYGYDYDGNVISEKFFGKLTGHPAEHPVIEKENAWRANSEAFEKNYGYSQDGLNLLIHERDETGRRTDYCYYPNTDRLYVKYDFAGSVLVKREIYHYDPQGFLIERIEDEGGTRDPHSLEGVLRRSITRWKLTQSLPMGLPLQEERLYLDLETGEEQLLSRQVKDYGPDCRVRTLRVHDGDGEEIFRQDYSYDALKNLVAIDDSRGRSEFFEYTWDGRLIRHQSPTGLVTEQAYDHGGFVKQSIISGLEGDSLYTSNTFDYRGLVQRSAGTLGAVTDYVYDSAGNLIRMTQGQSVYTYEYDVYGNVLSEVDALNRQTQHRYNARHQPIEHRYPDGSCETLRYTTSGRLHYKIRRDGMREIYDYDPVGRLTQLRIQDRSRAPISSHRWEYKGLQLAREERPDGTQVCYSYDGAGRLIERIESLGTRSLWEAYGYDAQGQRCMLSRGYGPEDPLRETEYRSYNAWGECVHSRWESADGQLLKEVHQTYDLDGHVTHRIEQCGGESHVTQFEYDSLGREILAVDALGNPRHTSHRWLAQPGGEFVYEKEVTDSRGLREITTHNLQGLVARYEVIDPLQGLVRAVRYSYDICGQLIEERHLGLDDAEDYVYTYGYDSMGRRIALEENTGSGQDMLWLWTWDKWGQLRSSTQPDGACLNYDYDARGCVSSVRSAAGDIHYSYQYDSSCRLIGIEDLVHGTQTRRTYDENGLLVEEQLGNGLRLGCTYDQAGRQVSQSYPDGSEVFFERDAWGLAALRYGPYTHIYADKNGWGQALVHDLPGKAGSLRHSYDELGRPLEQEHPQWRAGLVEEGFDAQGRPLGEELEAEGDVHRRDWDYDGLGRLTQDASLSFAWDAIGRPTEGTADVVRDWSYRGQVAEGWNCRYDSLGRLVEVSTDERRIRYGYDAFDRCLQRLEEVWEEGAWQHVDTQLFAYQGRCEVGSFSKDGQLRDLRILGGGQGAEIAAAVLFRLGDADYVPLYDQRGNVSALIDAADGALVELHVYDAFGVDLSTPGRSPWGFSSKRTDPATGWVHFGRRTYLPHQRCWLEPDPSGHPDGPDRTAFLGQNPVMRRDLFGLKAKPYTGMDGLPDEAQIMFWQMADWAGWPKPGKGPVPELGRDFVYDPPEPAPEPQVPYDFPEIDWMPMRPSNAVTDLMFVKDPAIRRELHFADSYIAKFHEWVDAEPHSRLRVLCCPGIANQPTDHKDYVRTVSRIFQGHRMYIVQNATYGIVGDLASAGIRSYVSTPAVNNMRRAARVLLNDLPGDGRLLLIVHSEGANVAWNALRDFTERQRQMIDVLAVAPAHAIPEGYFGSAVNLVNPGDLVSHMANFALNSVTGNRGQQAVYTYAFPGHSGDKHLSGGNIARLLQMPLSDITKNGTEHSFQSPMYQKLLTGRIQQYLNEGGLE
jgi:RHS repeat-associated protein